MKLPGSDGEAQRRKVMELRGKKINFLGDSITQGIGTSDVSQGFVALIGREEGLAAARNYGISGTRIARQTAASENPSEDRSSARKESDTKRRMKYSKAHSRIYALRAVRYPLDS